MCRWIAYSGEAIHLEELVFKRRHSLLTQSRRASEAMKAINGDGFGIGWYGCRTSPVLFRETMPAWLDPNLRNLCHHIKSTLFFAHVRASTGTATTKYNCHPFVCDQWMFVHNGQVADYRRISRQIDALIDEHCYQEREGTTDSEAIFLAIISRCRTGMTPIAATESVLSEIQQLMRQNNIKGPLRFTAALTDGESIYGFHYGSDDIAPTLYVSNIEGNVILASEPLDLQRECWQAIPLNHVLVITPNKPITSQALTIT